MLMLPVPDLHRYKVLAVLLAGFYASSLCAGSLPEIRALDKAPVATAGHVTVVNFWASWCAPCRAEMPMLDAFYRRHRAQGLVLVAVSLDAAPSELKLRQATQGFAFPVARIGDTRFARSDIPRALPTTRVYDANGRLVYASKGDGRSIIDAATLERVVSPLLTAH
jgi:cytochrome c biogenesis protein CcmG/thiol:disulfide interchange protein DsbE